MSQPASNATSERRLPAARLTDVISWAETECEAFSKFPHAAKDEKASYLHMLCMAILDLRDDVLEALRKDRNIPTEPPLEATQAVLEWNRGFFAANKLQPPLEIGMELSLAGRIWGIMAEAYNKRAIPSATRLTIPGCMAKRCEVSGAGNVVSMYFDTVANMEAFLASQRGEPE